MSVFRLFVEKMKCLKCKKVSIDENILAVKNYGFCDDCVKTYETMLLKQSINLTDKNELLVDLGPELVERCPVTGLPGYCSKNQCAAGNCDFAKAKSEWGIQ